MIRPVVKHKCLTNKSNATKAYLPNCTSTAILSFTKSVCLYEVNKGICPL